jgi:hypothetical protein
MTLHRQANPIYELNKKAQAVWRAYCLKPQAVDMAFEIFSWYYPGCVPEPFESSGNRRMRLAYDLLRGGVGRLRVKVGEPLELRRINYSAVHGLEGLAGDIFAQFEPGLVAGAFDALTANVSGPFWAAIERGRKNDQNHFHVFVKKGTCGLGVSSGVVSDAELPKRLAYFCKLPEWQLANVVGYLTVKEAYPAKPVAKRYKAVGLGSFKVTQKEIEDVTGLNLTKSLAEKHAGTHVPPSGPNPTAYVPVAL